MKLVGLIRFKVMIILGLIKWATRAGSLCQDLGALIQHNKNQFSDYYLTTDPAWLASIPVLRCQHPRSPGWTVTMFASNRTAG